MTNRKAEKLGGASAEKSVFPAGEKFDAQRRRRFWIVFALVGAGSLLRLLLAFVARRDITPFDDMDYLGRGLWFARGGAQDVWRAPMQVWLVGFSMRLTNYSFLLTRLIQAVLSCPMLLFAYWTARQFVEFRLAAVFLAVLVLWPEFYTFSMVLLSEGITATLLAAAVLMTVLALKIPSQKPARTFGLTAGAGLLWGATALARDEFFFVALALALPIALALRNWKRTLVLLVILVAPMLLVIAPYTARNIVRRHTYALITNHGAYNLWEHWNSRLSKKQLSEEYWGWPEPERQKRSMKKAFEALRENPVFVLNQAKRSFLRMFAPEIYGRFIHYSGWLGNRGVWLPRTYSIASACLICLALMGFFVHLFTRWRRPESWILYVLFFSSLLMHAIAFGQGRYRVPWMPQFLLFSVIGWHTALCRFREVRKPVVAGLSAGLVLYALAVVVLFGERLASHRHETEHQQEYQQARRLPQEMARHFGGMEIISRNRKVEWARQMSPPPPPPPGSPPAAR